MATPRSADDATEKPCPEMLADLAAILAADHAVYFRFGPEGAVVSVKGARVFDFGDSIGAKWCGMSAEERARFVLEWIQNAAAYCRKPRVRWCPANEA
jgi:hypothetical protein